MLHKLDGEAFKGAGVRALHRTFDVEPGVQVEAGDFGAHVLFGCFHLARKARDERSDSWGRIRSAPPHKGVEGLQKFL